jgi:hypothetical protein
MLSKVPLQASWPRPDTPYPLQLAQQNAATSLSASPPGGHPPAGQPSVTPIPQTSQQIAQQALQLYAIVSRSAEDFAHPASALAWLARARPARTGKITVPPENRWPKSVHGAGGYMDAFRAVGLTQRVHETKLGHWHWWYYDPKRVCLEALQLALTRRWRESQLRTSYPSTQSDLQTVSPPSTPMPHPQQTHSQPPSQMPLMQQQPPPMQQQPQHQQQQLLYDPSQNVYYTHPQATVYTTYSMMPPQAPPPQMMMSPDPLSMAGYPSYLQQQPTYQMQQRAERMYARMTQLDQQSMEMLYAQQQEQQRALQVQQLHLQALQRANTNGLNYAPSHPPSASQGLQQSTSTLFQPYQKTHPLPSPNEDGTAGPPPNLQTQQHQQAMAQLMQGSATGSTMNAHTATAASSSTIAVRPASDGSIYTPLALPPLESLTESASPSSLAVRNGTAATLALFNAAGGMHGGLQLGKTGKEGEMMGSGVGESAPATMSPTRSESIKLQPVQMQLQMQPQQPHHHRQQQHSSSDGKSPSAFFLRPSASLQYSGYPMVPLSNPQMLDPNSYYTGTYLQVSGGSTPWSVYW